MKYLILLLLSFFIFSNCSNNKKTQQTVSKVGDIAQNTITPNVLETVEVLEEVKEELRSVSKSYKRDDIITKLYEEALEKDDKLKELNDKINKIETIKKDSLKTYKDYLENNDNYWTAANRYIEQLEDSALKVSTQKLFQQSQANYKKQLLPHKSKLKTINKRTIALQDQLVLIKLMVSQIMMTNYQINEKPSIETLKNVLTDYDKLIKESNQFIKKQ